MTQPLSIRASPAGQQCRAQRLKRLGKVTPLRERDNFGEQDDAQKHATLHAICHLLENKRRACTVQDLLPSTTVVTHLGITRETNPHEPTPCGLAIA